MNSVVHDLSVGTPTLAEIPIPTLQKGGVLERTCTSLISAGTEKSMLELGAKSLLGKAAERPDLVKRTLEKLHRDGVMATLNAVQSQLQRWLPLGYSASGLVTAVAEDVAGFQVGDPIACAGAGYASHAEMNFVPRMLVARLPQGISFEAGAYTTVGSIALQGVRNADVRVGETVCVLGLGLLGQLTCQILRAAGCKVVASDLDQRRNALALENGTHAAVVPDRIEQAVMDLTGANGADAVLITAASRSNKPVEIAAALARDRARVVMVGVTGMDLPRRGYFAKELSFVVSRSYGPGRYDSQYEEHGHDYPIGYVRWTENRNMVAFLDLVAAGTVRPETLTTHRYPLEDAVAAYELILKGDEPHLGVVLEYPESDQDPQTVSDRIDLGHSVRAKTVQPGISFVGAGSFARGTLLRHLKSLDLRFRGIVSASGLSAVATGTRFGFDYCSSEVDELLDDDQTDCLFIATRHSQHADLIRRAVEAGKHVFVEKPLAVSREQLSEVVEVLKNSRSHLMVGFNRRFAPLAQQLKQHMRGDGPLQIVYRCNAGPLPGDHWLADPQEGGRIVGEACHFVDFCEFLTVALPSRVYAARTGTGCTDSVNFTLQMDDGSVCQIAYAADGSSRQAKEHVEVFGGGKSAVLYDFRRLECFGAEKTWRFGNRFKQDKGHAAELAAWVACLKGEADCPIDRESLVSTTMATFAVEESLRRCTVIELSEMAVIEETQTSQMKAEKKE